MGFSRHLSRSAEYHGANAGNIRQLFVNGCSREMPAADSQHGEAAKSAAMAQPASHEIQIA
jgi:hypothetical protein